MHGNLFNNRSLLTFKSHRIVHGDGESYLNSGLLLENFLTNKVEDGSHTFLIPEERTSDFLMQSS